MDYKDKLITLSDNIQYVIMLDVEYQGKTYVLANEVEGDDLAPGATIFRVETVNNEPKFYVEQDLSILENVLTLMLHQNMKEGEGENV